MASHPQGVKLTVWLADQRDGSSLWSSEFIVPPEELETIADLVNFEMQCAVGGAAEYPGSLVPAELKLFAQVCAALHLYTGGGPNRGRDLARELTARRPDFSRGWSNLSAANMVLALGAPAGPERTARFEDARSAAQIAVKHDPTNPEALGTLALLTPASDWSARAGGLAKAVDARVSACGCEWGWNAAFLLQAGQPRAAAEAYGRQIDMQPFSFQPIIEAAYAYDYAGDRRAADAMIAQISGRQKVGRLGLVLWNRAVRAHNWTKARSLLPGIMPPQPALEQVDAALASLERGGTVQSLARTALVKPSGSVEADEARARLLAAMGDFPAALNVVKSMLPSRTALEVPLDPAAAHALWLLWDPLFAPARNDRSYLALLRGSGVIDYWRKSGTRPEFCSAPGEPSLCYNLR